VILTDYQRAGRGRAGRSWTAPPRSSLLLSAVLDRPTASLPADVVMAASLAAAESIELVSGLRPELKWPNDLLYRGRKLCGILAEYVDREARPAVILGIGINVNLEPQAVAGIVSTATSLQRELGKPLSRERLAIALFKRLDLWYRDLTKDPDTVFAVWSSRLDTVGDPVIVRGDNGTWNGIATGVQRDGGLRVRSDTGDDCIVYAGDVSIRRPPAFTTP
jgi:BirA family biotin operon repressor/biotin-[acetyl-CoA-carboxylase] ligase